MTSVSSWPAKVATNGTPLWPWGRGSGWVAAGLLLGCGAATAGHKAGVHPGVEPRDTRILHEECAIDDDDARREDVNGDGRPDRLAVGEGTSKVCRGLDFNFDGVMDAWVYLEGNGVVRRRESDYDRDGRVDEVSLYKGGVLAERQRATTLAGKLDTWQYYASGKVARAERDSNGDDYVDQWWEYPAGRAEDCPLIHSDVDGDGRPDPGATVDVCREQYVPASRDGSGPAPAGEDEENAGALPSEVPTEVETPTAPEEGSSGGTPSDAPPAAPGGAKP